MKKLNVGCGYENYKGYINIDKNKDTKADIFIDLRFEPLPFLNKCIDEVWFNHTIEHIRKIHHEYIFTEFNRVLKKDGLLVISFPEFSNCYNNWKNNFQGKRDFWEATIYGRQFSDDDFHVCIIDRTLFLPYLENFGFKVDTCVSEPDREYNTIVSLNKISNMETRETVIAREIFQCQDA